MKKPGSETPADETEKIKAAPGEPVERARLQADVAKQRVRIAKEELKRARKRLKEAKREARRARKQAAVARKAWKQERRAADAKQTKAGETTQGKPRNAQEKRTKDNRAAAADKGAKPKRKVMAPAKAKAKARPATTSTAVHGANAARSPKKTAAGAKRKKQQKVTRQSAKKTTSPRTDDATGASPPIEVSTAAQPQELAAHEALSGNGAAVEHST